MTARFIKKIVVILGSGASRSVSYAPKKDYLSPLDRDFFDLLQRWSADSRDRKHEEEVRRVLHRVQTLPHEYWRSMERAFYTLHLRAYLAEKLEHHSQNDCDEDVVKDFAVSIQTLLRSAHGKARCDYHEKLFDKLTAPDTIITFNYDLVAERAIRKRFESKGKKFGPWLYGFERTGDDPDGPHLLKLHGSSNWELGAQDEEFTVRTKSWRDFDDAPGYRGDSGKGTVFPIFLPFWDKRIEKKPWLGLWRDAYKSLCAATHVIVWGYSLPPTDIKAEHLFSLSLGSNKNLKFCVIDPAAATRERWRKLLPDASYWEYQDIEQFLKLSLKSWWK